MNSNGAWNARQTPGGDREAVPFAGGAPPAPRRPPEPDAPPLVRWMRTPRPAARPGVWRPGHVPKPPEDPGRLSDRELLGSALLALVCGWTLYALCLTYLDFYAWPAIWVTPHHWRVAPEHLPENATADDVLVAWQTTMQIYDILFAVALICVFGRLGHGPEVWRRYAPAPMRRAWSALVSPFGWVSTYRRQLIAVLIGGVIWTACFTGNWMLWLEPLFLAVPDTWWEDGDTLTYRVVYNVYYVLFTLLLLTAVWSLGNLRAIPRRIRFGVRPGERRDPGGGAPGVTGSEIVPRAGLTEWAALRRAGAPDAADRLADDARSGVMSDLDYARIEHAWRAVRARPTELPAFAAAAEAQGAGAFPHASGRRDLTVRTARHDLLTRQVRIGHAPDEERNPYDYRGEDVALDPAVLGTSLLAVGPPGSGKTGRVIRPVTESLCLQALANQATVVAVGSASSSLGPDDAFDVILRIGDPASAYRLDLWGGATDIDGAAALLAEALVGGSRVEPRDAAAVLSQLIGPYYAAFGRLPGLAELRAMLDGAPALLRTLAERLDHAPDQRRDLEARQRQARRPDDIGPYLADWLALVDRAGLSPRPAPGARGPEVFSLSALTRPLRVRIDLPATGHAEAGRIITRLVLAQFTAAVTARPDRSLFACLVLDDATAAITQGAVRGLTHLRPANAGVVLALRTLDDVPADLRAGLLGAVGCRMAFSGITTWDAEHFARAWGTEWQEDVETTRTPDRAGGGLRRLVRGVRRLATGRDTTVDAVTVRRVERERWSASELAHRVPPRHAVISLTTVSGEPGPPTLVRLG
ncbi:ATP-binding protein [Streptomyces sp. PT12]|uniref:ATP-binding protein n=1 Tax=Streptomyces sp. PT12 TaxID=1510197 RepID=UPI00215C056E|nr:ATP-binding protein [Streptomyces sp. PT12]